MKTIRIYFTLLIIGLITTAWYIKNEDYYYMETKVVNTPVRPTDAQKIASYYVPSKEYFFEQSFFIQHTRSKIPFVYIKDTVKASKKALMAKNRE